MLKDKAADYFARHKASQECHITSDGRVFHTKGSADGFANNLKDNKVTSYKRAEFEIVNTEDSQDEDKESRFKSRVDRLIALGFERIDDLFAHLPTATSIDATSVYELTDEDFETGLNPLVVNVPDEAKVQALDALKKFDATTAQYAEIKALVKALGLYTENQKQEVLVAALEAHKAIINTEVQE